MKDLAFGSARRLLARASITTADLPATAASDETRHWAGVAPEALWRAVLPLWIASALALVAHALLAMAGPALLRFVIESLRDTRIAWQDGVAAAFGLAVTSACAWLAVSHGFVLGSRVTLRIRASLTHAVYQVALRKVQPGDAVVNLVATDVERVASGVADLATLVMSLVSIAVGMVLLFALLGAPAAAGLAVLVALIPLSSRQARRLEGAGEEAVAAADLRLARLHEVIAGIRTVKLSTWERIVSGWIASPRAREVAATGRYARHAAWLHALFLGSPVLLVVATFGLQAALGRPVVAADAFAAIALFGLLRPSLLFLPALVVSVSGARVSMRRIRAFLEETEGEAPAEAGEVGRITLSAATYRWPNGAPALRDVHLDIAPGELVVITGAVGAGKTALLHALLGELERTAGSARRSGRVAFAGQEPFLVNGSVLDNVRFGRAADDGRAARALAAVALDADALPDSVGEWGSRLSGGQRQRVALARALYGDTDIVLLDDPVSALDDRVAGIVVERALLDAWQGTTRIVVTNRKSIVDSADRVIVVEAGAVSDAGPRRDAVWQERAAHGDDEAAVPREAEVAQEGAGAVAAGVYRDYLKRLLPGALLGGVIALFVVREAFALGADAWLSWASRHGETGLRFVAGLALLGGTAALATLLRGLVVAVRGVAVGRALHDEALSGLLSARLRVFETTPAGRLLQRFGRDQRAIDQQISLVLLDAASTFALVVSTALVIVAATPLALALIVPAAYAGHRISAVFRPASRELRRFDAASHSPLLACVAESLQGAPTIRAFRLEAAFGERLVESLEPSQRALYASGVLQGWLSVRLECIGSALAGLVGALAVWGRTNVDPTLAALAITQALLVTYTLGRWVRTWAELESALTSVERVTALATLAPEEAVPSTRTATLAPGPVRGRVEFDGVDLRYAEEGPLALSKVSFTLAAGEKVGIVGRTGSGKSTLAAALVRIVSPERGRIRIDGVDIDRLPLAELRSQVTVVPQDPVMFEGSLRDNLDPGGRFDDATLRDALDRVGLPADLDLPVRRAGSNLSAGERQLSCIARALLAKSRVVVLDEATARLDPATELALRDVLHHALAGVTVITIAHRQETLARLDRILVMDAGRLRETSPQRSIP